MRQILFSLYCLVKDIRHASVLTSSKNMTIEVLKVSQNNYFTKIDRKRSKFDQQKLRNLEVSLSRENGSPCSCGFMQGKDGLNFFLTILTCYEGL